MMCGTQDAPVEGVAGRSVRAAISHHNEVMVQRSEGPVKRHGNPIRQITFWRTAETGLPTSKVHKQPLWMISPDSLLLRVVVCFLLIGSSLVKAQPANPSAAETAPESSTREGAAKSASPQLQQGTSSPTGGESNPANPLIPDFYLASVSLDAEVVGERVNIDAIVDVVINREAGWHRVPLRFDQAHIWKREYTGPGEESPDFNIRSTEDGIFWMLKGVGKHRLRFSMWLPIRRSVAGSFFQLPLPALPAQFDTKLKLKIPEPNAVLRAAPNLTVISSSRDAQSTTVEASIARNRLDIVWSVPQTTSELVSKVSTRFQLKQSPDHLLLFADQSIDLQQQDATEITVRMPSEFEFQNVTGARQQSFTPLPNRSGWGVVKLTEGTSGKLELRWLFRKPISKETSRVIIDGLEVEGAVQEAGTVQVDDLDGFRFVPQFSDSRMVYRINSEEAQRADLASINSVYEFLQQPFQLVHELRPIEPLHSVTPIYEVKFGLSSAELIVYQLVEVERGSISKLHLDWPQYGEESWELMESEATTLTDDDIKTETKTAENGISLTFLSPVQAEQRILVATRFRRPFMVEQTAEASWTIPTIPRQFLRRAWLVSTLADELELSFDKATAERFHEPTTPRHLEQLSKLWNLPELLRKRLTSAETKGFDPDQLNRFTAKVERHERTITAKTSIHIEDATPRDLLIQQTFQLDVQHGRLETVDLVIPAGLKKFLQVSDAASALDVRFHEEPLPLVQTGGVIKTVFPEPVAGTTTFDVRYRFPLDLNSQQQSFSLPVFSLAQFRISSAECLVTPIENVQVDQSNSNWVAVQTSPRGALWLNRFDVGSLNSVPVLIGGALVDSSQQFVVENAYLWTRFAADGRSETFCRYEIQSPPTRLLMGFPSNTEFKNVLVDGTLVPDNMIERQDATGEMFVISLPDGISDSRVIEIQFRNTNEAPFSFAEPKTFQFPTFSESVWVNETVWELQLPFGHHLFEYPALKPLFNWTRSGIVWERVPTRMTQAKRSELWTLIPPEFQFHDNFYTFQSFAPTRSAAFQSMNRSLILLIGAGFALGLGFVFYRFPVTRNVFSLVILAFAFSIASLWYLEPMLLLLQPAILGVILALTATLMDVRARKTLPDRSTVRRHQVPGAPLPLRDDSEVGEGTTRIYKTTESSVSNLTRD